MVQKLDQQLAKGLARDFRDLAAQKLPKIGDFRSTQFLERTRKVSIKTTFLTQHNF